MVSEERAEFLRAVGPGQKHVRDEPRLLLHRHDAGADVLGQRIETGDWKPADRVHEGSVAGTLRAVPSVPQVSSACEEGRVGCRRRVQTTASSRGWCATFSACSGTSSADGGSACARAHAGAGGWSSSGTAGRRRLDVRGADPRALRRGCREARDVPARLQHAVASAACES